MIFTRAPVPGRTKTRLCPPLAPEDAARLAGAFLQDEVAALSRIGGVDLTVAVTPDECAAELAALLPESEVAIVPQGPGDLGERLLRAFRSGCADGSPVVIVGSDTPDLPVAHVEEAFARLERDAFDVVLGPAMDGGYTLIGARAAHPALFRAIAWGTAEVAIATVEAAVSGGLEFAVVPMWEDVDDAESLRRLRIRLAVTPDSVAPRTRAVLTDLAVS